MNHQILPHFFPRPGNSAKTRLINPPNFPREKRRLSAPDIDITNRNAQNTIPRDPNGKWRSLTRTHTRRSGIFELLAGNILSISVDCLDAVRGPNCRRKLNNAKSRRRRTRVTFRCQNSRGTGSSGLPCFSLMAESKKITFLIVRLCCCDWFAITTCVGFVRLCGKYARKSVRFSFVAAS